MSKRARRTAAGWLTVILMGVSTAASGVSPTAQLGTPSTPDVSESNRTPSGTYHAAGSSLPAGQTLLKGQSLTSANGTYRAVLQTDGNLVVYRGSTPLWASYTKRATRAVMQTDGNFVIYDGSTPQWFTKTHGNPGAKLALADNGSLTVVSAGGAVLWRSPADPNVRTDTLPVGGTLNAGAQLRSANGAATLVMQTDGNLVRFEGGFATWASGTRGANPRLVLQTDGNLVIVTSDRGAVWSTRTHGQPSSRLVLQTDHNAVLYSSSNAPRWTTGLSRDAQVVQRVNTLRAQAGCGALSINYALTRAAVLHSRDMRDRNYFDHDTPEGLGPTERAQAQGYTGLAGENIAAGYPTVNDVMNGWWNSPGHKANMLECRYRTIGVGTAEGGYYGLYWTQVFGTD